MVNNDKIKWRTQKVLLNLILLKVVSGLPIRNGDNHAGEISTVALNILHSCIAFL